MDVEPGSRDLRVYRRNGETYDIVQRSLTFQRASQVVAVQGLLPKLINRISEHAGIQMKKQPDRSVGIF
jgi:hypothetical protein